MPTWLEHESGRAGFACVGENNKLHHSRNRGLTHKLTVPTSVELTELERPLRKIDNLTTHLLPSNPINLY
jgi:hypothetical protein